LNITIRLGDQVIESGGHTFPDGPHILTLSTAAALPVRGWHTGGPPGRESLKFNLKFLIKFFSSRPGSKTRSRS
jgi:hypothetical protein